MLKRYLPQSILLAPTPAPAPPAEGGEPKPATPPANQDQPNAPPAEPEPEPEPQPEPEKGTDPLLRAILSDMRGEDNVEPAPEPEPTPEPADAPKPPEPTPAATPPPTPEPAPAAQPKPRAKKSVTPFEPPTPTPSPAPALPAPPVVDPDADFVAGLPDDAREEIAEMAVAERLFPERYKGRRKALIEFYRTNGAALAAPDAEENPDLQRVLNTKPKLTTSDFKKVAREIGRAEITEKVKQEFAPEIRETNRKLRELDARPKVIAKVQRLDALVNSMFVTDDKSPLHAVSKAFAEKGVEVVTKDPDFALEVKVASEEMAKSKRMYAEYLLFQEGARDFDDRNPVHMALFDFIEDQGNALQEAGGLVRKGKRFLTRTQFVEQVKAIGEEAAAKKFFTFSDADVEQLFVEDTKTRIEERVKTTMSENTKLGFERKSKSNSAPPRNEPEPIAPPRAVPTRAKGAAEITPPTPQSQSPINVASTLYRR